MLSKDLAVKDRRYNAQVFSESAASARMELSRISTQALNSPALSPRELEVAVVGDGPNQEGRLLSISVPWEPVLLRHAPAGGGSRAEALIPLLKRLANSSYRDDPQYDRMALIFNAMLESGLTWKICDAADNRGKSAILVTPCAVDTRSFALQHPKDEHVSRHRWCRGSGPSV